MQGMTTFDFITAQVVFFLMFYVVYKETPFKNEFDNFFKMYFDSVCKKMESIFETVSQMNGFLLLDYENYHTNQNNNENSNEDTKKEDDMKVEVKKEEKYEDKYIQRFKSFPNDYVYSVEEENKMREKYEELRVNFENDVRKNMERVLQKIDHVDMIIKKGVETDEGVRDLLGFYDYDYDEYKEDPDYLENVTVCYKKIEELYDGLSSEKHLYEIKLEELKCQSPDDEKLYKEAKDYVLSQNLNNLKNCYVMEFTPLGNVVMRYDNERGTFEYFSNNSIPYRYLEPVGRKYVMTYFCKPLFVDLEEELKRAEEKYDSEKSATEEKQRISKINQPKQVFANLKSYNTPLLKTTPLSLPSKNRETSKFVLPPQIKANLPNVNTKSDKHLLKENANRYTWEGRFSNLNLLKKIDRKQIDKKYAMTFADFKKMQSSLSTK